MPPIQEIYKTKTKRKTYFGMSMHLICHQSTNTLLIVVRRESREKVEVQKEGPTTPTEREIKSPRACIKS